MKISYGKCVQTSKDIKALTNRLKETTQMGKCTKIFEKKISKMFQKKYGLMVNSGSSALMIAYDILPFKKGSNFITPVLTFSTTVGTMTKAGYIPNFIDVNLNNFCIDEDKIEKAINKKTVGIVIPNLIGFLPNWKKISKIAKKYKLLIIEDSADTLGGKVDNVSSGKYSDISITSFYGSHIITCAGNGGMICLNDKNLYIKSCLLRSWGRRSSLFGNNSELIKNRFGKKIGGIFYDQKFVFDEIGYNFEPSEIGSAYGLEQLKRLKNNIKKRRNNFEIHNGFFSKFSLFKKPIIEKNINTALLAYPINIKPNKFFSRTDLQIYLEKQGIQTRPVFTGNILKQPAFKKIKCIKNGNFKNANHIMKNSLLIACHHGLSKKNLNFIHSKIFNFVKIKTAQVVHK